MKINSSLYDGDSPLKAISYAKTDFSLRTYINTETGIKHIRMQWNLLVTEFQDFWTIFMYVQLTV
jgi:hypothetical protein